ncbi:hypothetical protein ACJZ2D_009232 [Fusarium nematophilum]
MIGLSSAFAMAALAVDTISAYEVYDYIVVGSGPGGGPLACNLARAGYKTLLLEAGDDHGDDPIWNTLSNNYAALNNNSWTQQPNNVLRIIHGLANVTDQDADNIPELVTRDVNAQDPDRDQEVGFFGMSLHMDANGRRSGSNSYIRDTLSDPANYPLTVQLSSFVTRVLFDKHGPVPVANGVEVLRGQAVYRADPRWTRKNKGKRTKIMARREVIVSGGTFNSPQILKHSGVGPAAELKKFGIKVVKDLPGVGENMTENYEAGVLGLASDDINRNAGQTGLLLKTPTETGDRNIHAWCGAFALEGFWPGMPNNHGPRQYICAMAHMQPRSRAGSVRLRSADPTDTPEINFRFWEVGGDEDLRELVDAVKIMRRGFNAAGSPVTPWNELHPCHGGATNCTDEDQLDYFRHQSFGHHASSTCAIGASDDPMAVVDSKFRVHGVKNLRVVDASVFPHVPGAFPVLPTFIISDKASRDIIKAARST